MPKIKNILDVSENQLCVGCGACAYIAPENARMIDVLEHGRRPEFTSTADANRVAEETLAVCPGADMSHLHDSPVRPGFDHPLAKSWGPILEIWEGYASNPETRLNGSSGGAITALADYCMTELAMGGLLHVAARKDVPYLNETVLSTSPKEVRKHVGSRYAPASPCDRLDLVEESISPCVVAGKPCDINAVSRARKLRPALDAKVGLTIACFCAGTPTTKGTLEMLKVMGLEDPSDLSSLTYRGPGWPGKAEAIWQDDQGETKSKKLTYEESWGAILTRHKQWRCNLCPDRTGEFADLGVGDPWYQEVKADDPGRSMIIVRTELGRSIVQGAMENGYLTLTPAEDWKLPASQHWVPSLKGSIWGRLVALRMLGCFVPRIRGFRLFGHWCKNLNFTEKLRSMVGILKRLRTRRLKQRIAMVEEGPAKNKS